MGSDSLVTAHGVTNVKEVAVASGENFPLSEDDIDTVDVTVIPGAPDFQDVEITWAHAAPEDSDSDDTGGDKQDAEDYEWAPVRL